MSGNGLLRGQTVGASANRTEEGPRKPKSLPQNVSIVWDELSKHVRTDAWRSSDQFLFQTLCELIVQLRTLSLATREQPLEPRITISWLSVIEKVRSLAVVFGLSPKISTRRESEMDEFGPWTSHHHN